MKILNNEIKFLEEDIRKLEELEEIGICLHYIFLKTENKSNESFETHKKVAIASMNKIKEIMFNGIKNNLSKKKSKEITVENWPYFMVEIYEEKMNAEKIKCNRFWEEKGYYEKCSSDGIEYGSWVHGYKSAFFEPIFPIKISIEEQEKLFNDINNKYLSPFNDENLEIYSWNDDWSNYFDSGKEYWGTFFWTIYNKEKEIFIAIGASTTG